MKRGVYILLLAVIVGCTIYGCKKYLPSDLESFSLEMNFTLRDYAPMLGRTTFYADNFNNGQSSLPLDFRISAVRTFDGKPAPELLKLFPVQIWTDRYTGEETSLEEIRAKRTTVMRPLWDIGQHSGTFTMYPEANSILLKSLPDSCYLFDVEVSSSGGRRYFRDLKLTPQKEQDFEVGGITFLNMRGDSTRSLLFGTRVWFNRKGDGNTLSFKILNPDLSPIELTKFETTQWDDLVHGFNKQFSSDFSEVTYDVEYPIPLVPSIKTKYTSDDGFATVRFSFDRIISGGAIQTSSITIPFKIHRAGDWEVIIYFPEEKPLFDND